ncbi:MAG: glycosyltransferase family 4 protein [Phycisphaerae bacterium]|jgi:glycosyltransferase involved in cell wall biosynthesis|nr:glycosyltransferase family 4 protein [Phycisphaerae bacterium]
MAGAGISLAQMAGVIHIIGADTSADMLRQAAALPGEQDTIVSIGPVRRGEGFDRDTVSIRAPLGSGTLAGLQLSRFPNDAELLHAWSPSAATTAQWAARGRPILLSLPHLRGVHQADIAISGCFDGLWTLTTPTDPQRRVLIALGLDPKRVFVLPPTAQYHGNPNERRAEIRNELGLDDRHFLLAAAGEMVHANGHKQACWAHAMARILTDHTRLVFPGSGPARRAIETFARSTGHIGEIFFTGERLDPSDVLTAADAAIFLHRHDCGVGALAGAMACGLPTLASGRPEIADCAPDRRAALLSPPGDMRRAADDLLTLARDTELQKTLGREASILAAEKFAPDVTRTRLRTIYSTVLSGRS